MFFAMILELEVVLHNQLDFGKILFLCTFPHNQEACLSTPGKSKMEQNKPRGQITGTFKFLSRGCVTYDKRRLFLSVRVISRSWCAFKAPTFKWYTQIILVPILLCVYV